MVTSTLYSTGNTWTVHSITPTTMKERFLLFFKRSYDKYETLKVEKTKYDKTTDQIMEVRRITTYKSLGDKEFVIKSNLYLSVSYREREKKS